ncbi:MULTISPECIES: hypothetical protein [unclassified Frankia]|uniref:hypothetical protein n=1 Tax=unclassified Frankia TaxID=2632575 RepID=UPI002AD35F3C|nr:MULTISPECIES: hypothetical protein [unclassified Frankia]
MDLMKIPQVRDWTSGGSEFDPRAFVLSNVTVAEAVAVSMILWPEFIEYRGCLFLKFLFDEQGVDTWFEQLQGDRRSIEAVVNHLHLWDVLAPGCDVEYDVLGDFANRIAEMWRAVVRVCFPSRSFIVETRNDTKEYGSTLVFYSVE